MQGILLLCRHADHIPLVEGHSILDTHIETCYTNIIWLHNNNCDSYIVVLHCPEKVIKFPQSYLMQRSLKCDGVLLFCFGTVKMHMYMTLCAPVGTGIADGDMGPMWGLGLQVYLLLHLIC